MVSGEAGEKVGEIDVVKRGVCAGKLLSPIRWRLEILPGGMPAQLIVGGALLRVLKRFVGLCHLLEFFFRVGLLRNIGMILARKLAIGLLDVVCARPAIDAQDG